MSGFEIAGLVIGSIPLVIEGMSLYAKGAAKIKDIYHYEIIFNQIHTRLQLLQWTVRQTYEHIIDNASLPDGKLQELLSCSSPEWSSPQLERVLTESMGVHAYSIAMETSKIIHQQLRHLATDLGLDENWRPPFVVDGVVDKSRRNKFFKTRFKVQGGFHSDRHHAMIDRLQADANTLRDNVLSDGQLGSRRQEKQQVAKSSPYSWIKIRDHSKRLYSVLHSTFFSRSCMSHQHLAHIRLRAPRERNSGDIPHDIACSFMVRPEPGQEATSLWCVRHAYLLPQAVTSSSAVQVATNHREEFPSIQISDVDDGSDHAKFGQNSEISDLCASLEKNSDHESCWGYLDDQKWKYHIYEDAECSQSEPGLTEAISLQEKLRDFNTGLELTTRNKRQIALLLAWAVLQLHGTAWLKQTWTLDDVYLMENSELHVPGNSSSLGHAAATEHHHGSILRNETLFSLGEALLGLTFRDYQRPSDPSPVARWEAASSKVQELRKHELGNIVSAVENCLEPRSPTRFNFDLEDESFLCWYYESIVIPLKDDYDMLLGPSRSSNAQSGGVYVPAQTTEKENTVTPVSSAFTSATLYSTSTNADPRAMTTLTHARSKSQKIRDFAKGTLRRGSSSISSVAKSGL